MATKDRHRINIWITDKQYEALKNLKRLEGRSMNAIAQTAVANEIKTLMLIRDSFPHPHSKDAEKSRQVQRDYRFTAARGSDKMQFAGSDF